MINRWWSTPPNTFRSIQFSPIQSNLPYSHRKHIDCTIPPQHDHLHTQADLTRQSQAVVCQSLSASWHQQQKCQSVTGTPSLSLSLLLPTTIAKQQKLITLVHSEHNTTIQAKSNKNIINNSKAKQKISKRWWKKGNSTWWVREIEIEIQSWKVPVLWWSSSKENLFLLWSLSSSSSSSPKHHRSDCKKIETTVRKCWERD